MVVKEKTVEIIAEDVIAAKNETISDNDDGNVKNKNDCGRRKWNDQRKKRWNYKLREKKKMCGVCDTKVKKSIKHNIHRIS